MKMPPLNMDEALLIVDTYNSMRKVKSKATKTSFYKDLSDVLRSLPFYPELKNEPQFRSESAAEIMLNNIFYTETKREGVWTRLTQRQEQIIEYYKNDPHMLHDVCLTIRSIASMGIDIPLTEAPDSFMGGSLLYSFHKYVEEQGEQAKAFREEFRHETVCSLCGTDMRSIYGANAEKLMSIHYAAPISWYPSALQLMSAEYIPLCPACHSLAHTEVKLLEEENLRKAFSSNKK